MCGSIAIVTLENGFAAGHGEVQEAAGAFSSFVD